VVAGAGEGVVAGLLVVPIVLDAGLLGVVLLSALLGFTLAPVALEAVPEALCAEPAVVSGLEVGVVALGVAAAAVLLLSVADDAALLAFAGLLLLLVEVPVLAFTVNCSFTCFTPLRDLAISLARFLSALLATVPVSVAVPLVTETCTPANAGSWLNLA
jgi:hypothetical protein